VSDILNVQDERLESDFVMQQQVYNTRRQLSELLAWFQWRLKIKAITRCRFLSATKNTFERTSFLYGNQCWCRFASSKRSIDDLHYAGEQITKIRVFFSGSLSYIFNRFSAEDVPFQPAVDAEKTDTRNPTRDDLSGSGVARKCVLMGVEDSRF
jgi:hypothetical protein